VKQGIKNSLVTFLNLGLGFISFWWFSLAYATAVNIDNKSDANDLIPIGILALILLPVLVIVINYAYTDI